MIRVPRERTVPSGSQSAIVCHGHILHLKKVHPHQPSLHMCQEGVVDGRITPEEPRHRVPRGRLPLAKCPWILVNPSQSVGKWTSSWRSWDRHVVHIPWQVLVQLLRHKARQANGGEDGPPLAACGRRRRPAFTSMGGVVVSSAAAKNPGRQSRDSLGL